MIEQIAQLYAYLHGMWRYRWSALLVAWLVALMGWLVVFALPDQFSAKAVVYVDTQSVMKPLLKGLAVEIDETEELEVMSRVLLSRENLLTVIRETDMDLEIQTPEERERLVEDLAGSIVLKGGGTGKRWEPTSNIYEIEYQGNSAKRVYEVVSNLLNTMIENTLGSSRTDTARAEKFLDKQIAEYGQRLTLAEQRLAEFKKANIGFMPDEKGGYYMRLQRAQEETEDTRGALRLAERRQSELRKQLSGETPLLDSDSYGAEAAVRLREYREELDSLLAQYTEAHPDVEALRKKIAALEANETADLDAIADVDATSDVDAREVGTNGEAIEFNPVYQDLKLAMSEATVEVETLRIQVAERERRVERLKASIDSIPQVEAELARLNRDYEVTRERYLGLVERRESARLAQDAGQSSSEVSFRVIEPPVVPLRPTGPNRLLLLAAALCAALAAGAGWALLRYLLYPTFINARQLREETGFPILGSVSNYLTPQHRRHRHLQLAAYLSVAVLLLAAFGGVLWQREAATALVGAMVEGTPRTL
jgi:polysaccharide chain length determinant protein (PEP-CTERM system associated)